MRFKGLIKDIIPDLLKLDLEKYYDVSVKILRSKRSLEQNNLFWKIVHLIAKEVNQDDYDVYCAILERADAKSDYFITEKEMEEELRKRFRAVKFIKYQEVNGVDRPIYKVYLGSSTMNTKEMSELIDTSIAIAGEFRICIDDAYD